MTRGNHPATRAASDVVDPHKKTKNYLWTLFNYTDVEVAKLKSLNLKYLVFGYEICPETQRPHLQGYLVLIKEKTLTACKTFIGINHIHLKQAKADALANYKYCTKTRPEDEVPNAVVVEIGVRPRTNKEKGEGEKERFEHARQCAKEGRFGKFISYQVVCYLILLLDDIDADIYVRNGSWLHKIHTMAQPIPVTLNHGDQDTPNEWHYGPTGCGKSRRAVEGNPGAYKKDASNKWFESYAGEKVVIVEDIDPFHKSQAYHLKMWGDRYAFRADIKNSSCLARPDKVIVTSNFRPEEIWTDEGTLGPIYRRYKMYKWNSDGTYEITKPGDDNHKWELNANSTSAFVRHFNNINQS